MAAPTTPQARTNSEPVLTRPLTHDDFASMIRLDNAHQDGFRRMQSAHFGTRVIRNLSGLVIANAGWAGARSVAGELLLDTHGDGR